MAINSRAGLPSLHTVLCLSHTSSPSLSMKIPSRALFLFCCIWATLAQKQDGEDAAEGTKSKKALNEPIQFVTKAKDQCSLRVTELEDVTRMRVQCKSQEAAYWCEYEGKPVVCRNYITNSRHYFTQIMWELRKLQNACQGPQTFKPPICKRASDEAQLALTVGASPVQQEARRPDLKQNPSVKQEQAKPEQAKPELLTPAARPDQAKTEQTKPSGAGQKPARQRPAKPQPTRLQPAKPAKVKPDQAKVDQAKTAAKSTNLQKMVVPKTTAQIPTTSVPTSSAENMAQHYCWHSIKDFCTQVFSWFNN